MKEKRPVGAPRGNQNARKHGLYSRVLDEDQKLEIDKSRAIKGIDEEIAVMRVKLRTLLEKYPGRIDLQMRAIATIARMVRTRLLICAAFDNCFVARPRRARGRAHLKERPYGDVNTNRRRGGHGGRGCGWIATAAAAASQ